MCPLHAHYQLKNELQHDKINKMTCVSCEDSDQAAQSDQSLLGALWVAKDPSFLHSDSEDSEQTRQMPRLT